MLFSKDFIKDASSGFSGSLCFRGGFWRYVNPDERSSDAVKFDKFSQEKIKKLLLSRKPKTSILSGQSIRELLIPHSKNKYILHVDIEKYYENIDKSLVIQYLKRSNIFDEEHLALFESFYFDGKMGLRRGLGASPVISEIVGLKMDAQAGELLFKDGLRQSVIYSRYYDDVFFSSDDIEELRVVERIFSEKIKPLGLAFNTGKTKLFSSCGAKILGLRIMKGNVTVSKKDKKYLRPKICRLEKLYGRCKDEAWRDRDDLCDAIDQAYRVVGTLAFIITNSSDENEKYIVLKEKYSGMLSELFSHLRELDESEVFVAS